jgi:integrase
MNTKEIMNYFKLARMQELKIIAEFEMQFEQAKVTNSGISNLIFFPTAMVVNHIEPADESPSAPKDIYNFISSSTKNSNLKQKEYKLTMQNKILNIKNCRYRADGRYEWRKTINGKVHQVIERDPDLFLKKISKYKSELKKKSDKAATSPTPSRRLTDVCRENFHNEIEPKLRAKTIKAVSAKMYTSLLNNHLCTLKKNIDDYTRAELAAFINTASGHRVGCRLYQMLKRVFAYETAKGNLKINPMALIANPYPTSKCVTKGEWVDLDGQQKIMANINKPFGKQVLFYSVTGCRIQEAYNTTIDFDKRIAHISGTKTKASKSRYIQLSKSFCDLIKGDWTDMFAQSVDYTSRNVRTFLTAIGISGKTTHSLRHTFASNLYYLGIPDKMRQYLLGHSSIVMTNDIYTTLNPTIKRKDIVDIYGDFYPEF